MTAYNFILVHTGGGRRYAERIANSIHWINLHKSIGRGHTFNTHIVSVGNLHNLAHDLFEELDVVDTIIHARAAYPDLTGWMRHLINLERGGFTVINNTDVLLLTSNKLECAMRLQDHFPHPRTTVHFKGGTEFSDDISRFLDSIEDFGTFIAKPNTSIEQGASVKKINMDQWPIEIFNQIESVPGNPVVLQEYIPYSAIYRVIVIGGHALPYSFVDRPTPERWKVSVCLNRTSMEFVPNPNPELLRLGENVQRFIGGEINFIDFFETEPGNFVISEINTACNLRIHEMLAKRAGHPKWNIHFNIARYLVNRTLGGLNV